jgi:hypothetical protein
MKLNEVFASSFGVILHLYHAVRVPAFTGAPVMMAVPGGRKKTTAFLLLFVLIVKR